MRLRLAVIPVSETSPESLFHEYLADSGQVRQNSPLGLRPNETSVLPERARMTIIYNIA